MGKNLKPLEVLPCDIIFENILPRLPVKSLIKCTSVCKAWCSVIKSSRFIAQNLDFNQSDPRHHHLLLGNNHAFILDQDTLLQLEEYGLPLQLGHLMRGPIETCNGLNFLQCFKERERCFEYVMWNPSIRKIKKLNSVINHGISDDKETFTSEIYGLGFQESSGDHKVVRIVYAFSLSGNVYTRSSLVDCSGSQVDVYSLSTNSWHKVDSNPGRLIALFGGVYMNGAIHWLASCRLRIRPRGESILSFNFQDECFGKLALPKDTHRWRALKEFQGSLAAIDAGNYCVCHVWVMMQYGDASSWTKLFTVSIPMYCWINWEWPFFTKNGWFLCHNGDNRRSHGIFFGKNGQSKHMEESWGMVKVVDYMESLVLLTN